MKACAQNQPGFSLRPGALALQTGVWTDMTGMKGAALVAACALVAAPVAAQQSMLMVPTGPNDAKPVPQNVVVPDDTPEEIARDAAGDLKDARFYNKPGATRAQYNADWQQCRLIARGSKTPSGSTPFFYNPAVISPLAAGIGGGIAGFIAGKIKEGQLRRANRRTCLMIRGWRLVEVAPADAARIAAMTDADRSAHFDTIVGATEVKGKVTDRTRFVQETDAALRLDSPLTQPGTMWVGKKVDPAAPFVLAPGEAAVVLGFRRADPVTMGKSGALTLRRYDAAARDLVLQPKNWKKVGDKTTYTLAAPSRDKKATYEVQLLRITPGDYVVDALTAGYTDEPSTLCFGAPTLRIAAGEVVYLGDFAPYENAKRIDGTKVSMLAHTMHPDDARTALAARQPALAAAFRPAAWRNQATYACAGVRMDRWDVDGAPAIEPAAAVQTAAR